MTKQKSLILKRICSIAVCLTLILGLCPQTVMITFASESDFVIEDGVLVEYNGPGGHVVIPDGVTKIKGSAVYGGGVFEGKESITSVAIPDSVVSIGSRAFYGCKYLTSIKMSNNITLIGDNAFFGCENIQSLNIPEGVTSIGERAFYNCKLITSITLPNNLATIKSQSFKGCKSLSEIAIPDSVTNIGDYAFDGCSSLQYVGLHKNISSLGKGVFRDCGIVSITIPEGLTKIDDQLFRGCSNLLSIYIPSSVVTIGSRAFENCDALVSIGIPDSVTSMGSEVFYSCENLKTVKLSNSITSLDSSMFMYCSSLESLVIPDSVSIIKDYILGSCSKIKYVVIPDSVLVIDNSAFGNVNKEAILVTDNETAVEHAKEKGLHYASLSMANNIIEVDSPVYYSGSAVQPKVNVYTKDGFKIPEEYYIVQYSNNTNIGKGTVKVIGKEPFNGSEGTATFDIKSHKYASTFTVDKEATCTENGSKSKHCLECGVKTEVTVILATGHKWGNWTVTKKATCTSRGTEQRKCSNCSRTETRYISAKGHNYEEVLVKASTEENGYSCSKCKNCSGTKNWVTIAKVDSVKLSKTSYTYNGKAKKPSVKVIDSNDKVVSSKYYTVSYKNNKKIGKATVTIKFKGNYSGTVKKTFKIVPGKVKISKVAPKSKAFTLKWGKVKEISGYQIEYSTSKKFTKKTTKVVTVSKGSVSKQIKKLKVGKKYYIRVRAYKTVSKVKYYGAWSSVKSVKTK